MDEETTRKVMIKYFQSMGLNPNPQRGAGPDIMIDGTAIEVKGTRYDVRRLLNQIVDYTYKHKRVGVALPIDGLNLEIVQQIETLCFNFTHGIGKILDLYVVFDSPNHNTFYVHECTSATGIISLGMFFRIGGILLNKKDTLTTAKQKLDVVFSYEPVKWARLFSQGAYVAQDGQMMSVTGGKVSKIEL